MGSASEFPENKLATALMVVLGLGIAALTIADVPPASWINEFQARSLGYSRKLTMVVLVIVILGPAAAIWAVVKAVREGSAAYARGEDEDDEDLDPPRRRRRRRDYDDDHPPPRRRRRDED
jgi:hypothetical protein